MDERLVPGKSLFFYKRFLVTKITNHFITETLSKKLTNVPDLLSKSRALYNLLQGSCVFIQQLNQCCSQFIGVVPPRIILIRKVGTIGTRICQSLLIAVHKLRAIVE